MKRRLTPIALCLLLLLLPSLSFAAKSHKVKKKETLASIARKYRVSTDELKSANSFVNNHLKPGDVLVIPPRADAGQSSTAPARVDTAYRVKKGDTLGSIAKKTGISVTDLKRINDLQAKRPKLKPGQVLALKETEHASEPKTKKTKLARSFRNAELFKDEEFDRTLDDLTVADPSKPVDLAKSIELGSSKDENIAALKQTAYSFLGARYRFGGTSRTSLDCSSFVQQVFRDMNISLPRTAREQFTVGDVVSPASLQKGDLVFFQTYARFPSHVGIYLGGSKMIHASSRDRRVVISTFNTPYYLSRFIGAKRISKINPDVFNFSDLLTGIEEEREDDIMANDTLGLNTN